MSVLNRDTANATDFSSGSKPYSLHSNEECDRLERQGQIAQIDGHLAYIQLPPLARVLDAGCGSGSMSRLIARARPDATVVGVDFQQAYVDDAATRAQRESIVNVTFRQGDVFSLPFPDAHFDAVWSKYLLQWLTEPKRALREFKRVINPGGILVSCDFDSFITEHFPVSTVFERKVRRIIAEIVDPYTGRKIASYLMELGFADVQVSIETDRVYTVVGRIDPERRQNWETCWASMLPRVTTLLGPEVAAKEFVDEFMAYNDDPTTCTFTSLFFTRGRLPR
jgi:ubiquinone/menaquinone biosynthesis C-methylase UbiE